MINNFDITLSNPREIMNTIEFKYDNYDVIKNTSGDFMIVGSENCKNEVRDAGKTVEYTNYAIFIDMIFLAAKLNLKGGFRTFIKSQLTEQHFLLILKFCKKYGLPYCGNIQENALQYNNYNDDGLFTAETLNEIKRKHKYTTMCYAFCNVSYFVYWLYIMYRDFLWYISIFSKDMAYSFTEYLKIDMLPYIERGGVVGKFFSPSIVQHFSFNSRLQRSGNSFSFTISTNNIFHLSVYYFCLICIGNNTIDISKTMLIKQCKCCGTYFLTTQSRKKYCEYCSPQKAWNKKNR